MLAVVDTSQFNSFCKQIAAQTSVKGMQLKIWDVMLFEVGKVLESCIRLTTGARADRIRRSVEFRNRTLNEGDTGGRSRGNKRSPIIYVTKAGVVWFADQPGAGYEGVAKGRRTGTGKTFHPMTEHFHYGLPRWNRYKTFLSQLQGNYIIVKEVIGRAGRSWVDIADSLGVRVSAPGYVRNAIPFRDRRYINGRSRKSKTANGLFLEIENTAPILMGTIEGSRILQTSINGRAAYFRKNMKLAVFEDVKEVAKAYPSFIAA